MYKMNLKRIAALIIVSIVAVVVVVYILK